jgi:hypothetical protein
MFHQLVNHNADIKRLVEKGYAVAFDGLATRNFTTHLTAILIHSPVAGGIWV